MIFVLKTKWSDAFRRKLLLSALIAPAILASSSLSAQTIANEAKVELASVDTATTSPIDDVENIAAEPVKPAIDAVKLELAEAAKSFVKNADDKLDSADRAGIAAFYEDNGYTNVWMENGQLSEQANALVAEISQADRNGLNPTDYAPPVLDEGLALSATELFDADLKMSLSAVRYVRHIASGRLVPQSVSAALDMNPERPNAKSVLADLSIADNAVSELNDYHPKHPAYHALLRQLETIRTEKVEKPIVVGDGKMLKPGMSDPRVLQLRLRLKIDAPVAEAAEENAIAAEIDESIYDPVLVAAVKEFQKSNHLSQDGIIGPSTLRTLNGDANVDRKTQILVNLERWRWMPKELGAFHIFANIPEYRVFVKQDGKVAHTTRVVVGKPKHATVAFSDEMEHFVVNPSWGVPKSIIKNEMLPSARSNPGYFSRKGYQVFARIKGRTRRIDPNRVNWRRVSASQISVRQPPGARNALGQIKFLFPNKHAIYMHDTPSKSLFKRDSRAFSHGCVRIHNPMEFADAILAHQPEWNSTRIKRLVGGKESTVNFDKHIPVHIAYFTATLKDDGSIGYLKDIYGHDRKMAKVLKL